ncbi:MAG: hypothetical protein CMH31_05955 [Micavibrio sp.]|nr:hypothetical protein [Micavibrio sp.]|tara:strand:+ start:822 stop:1325 length:504 start_codon:yes stop_codon:yes gene_type:complete
MNKLEDFIKWVKSNIIISLSIGVLILIAGYFIVQVIMPKKGNMIYGFCGVFLEQQMTFPDTLEHTYVEMYRSAVRIYYKNIDAYGQQNFSYIECSFVQDPQQGVQLDNVIFKSPVKDITEKFYDEERKRSFYRVKPEKIKLFNRSKSSAVIMSQDPDLTLPEPKAMF